ncbi:collagenase [Candidatus Viridilinea mediisalina]|uniref:DUF1570 domain-containing protein n=1 Tax=Candidatus Viridilinea mediisalina TaxID=2024553 RepID=A0A2A6RGT6_9CHLR|nr:collagenase [Candidatus Viridilinea mediisalina]PDW02232.1 hypothetical protein CJ255_15065 [Candidatus Viridilinea mediisalina]
MLTSSALPVALAPRPQPIVATPACPQIYYADAAALLAALPTADYGCTEELARALRPRADQALVTELLALAQTGPDARAQRNALRTLGRLAASAPRSHTYELLHYTNGAALQSLAVDLLATSNDNFLLQDAVWLLDTFFYPSLGAAPVLAQVADTAELAPALRYRAAAARARLLLARPGPLDPSDRAFILNGLTSDDAGVRSAAATAIAHLRPAQQREAHHELEAALVAAWHAEPALSLAPDPPDPRALSQFSFQESSPTSLSARAAIARARDRLAGHQHAFYLEALRVEYEALALPATHVQPGACPMPIAAQRLPLINAVINVARCATEWSIIRSGLPAAQLPSLSAEVARTHAAWHALVGPALAQRLPDAHGRPLTIMIFARQGIYRDYMRAFTSFRVDVDGVYDQESATIYTYQRTAAQSANSLEESLRHELAHHYAATRLFPGDWHTPGYHREPKGWADEGLAELFAGLGPDGFAPRPAQLARLCARAHAPPLTTLLAQRTGYDAFGHFDYDAAWAFTFYMQRQQPVALRRIYAAYRSNSYRLAHWEASAGISIVQAEAEWHQAIRVWCSF